ncbi:hypothetical protein [Vibrio jasicida]|uniref:hypothetical protein n=1 Tax=Vibrio jasicida TaxID=766224 RepID=UPI000CE40A72|nr:hypothetical protein [Vibrio jasicida]
MTELSQVATVSLLFLMVSGVRAALKNNVKALNRVIRRLVIFIVALVGVFIVDDLTYRWDCPHSVVSAEVGDTTESVMDTGYGIRGMRAFRS